MASMGIFILPLLFYAASLIDARSPFQLEKTEGSSGSDWGKHPLHGKEDYYGFLTEGFKRTGPHHPHDEKYMDFLLGDKRAREKKNHADAYWDFLGADSKRTNTRKKRSSDGARPRPSIPSAVTHGDSNHPAGSQSRRLDPRSAPHDIEDSWDDFVVGRRSSARDEGVNFDDFLMGDKRGHASDYDYSEFVLGKRP